MSQHDMSIANQGFPAFRSDLNDALGALVSNSSGSTAPTSPFAHQFWVDTSADPSVLKVRNADNDAWIIVGEINQTDDKFKLTPSDGIESDTINELTSNAGVTIEGVLIKDSGIASAGSPVTINGATPTTNNVLGRNRIINGAMMIDQRNAGASVTPANGAYTLDRWAAFTNGAGVYTVQQSSTAPAGFTNSLLCTVTTTDSSVTGSDYYMLQHMIEGFNVADLGWGTANAQTVTVSFWVRSSITGTYTVKLGNSASNRSYVATYTINSANTWEQKSITVAGDTTGTWLTNNGVGIEMRFAMAIGSSFTTSSPNQWNATGSFGSTTASNNWIGTNGATFYITGVQLEKGSTATSFDYRPYGTELALCQRYCFRATSYDLGKAQDTTYPYGVLRLPVTMRASASYTASSGTFTVNSGNAGVVALVFSSVDTAFFYNSSSNWTATAFVQVSATLTAEL